jgi:hypothetical protein
MFNERYLHHYISYRLQESIALIDITSQKDIIIHPEWPTFKKSTNLQFGKYRKANNKYVPDSNGTAGFIDLAIGNYNNPLIGIEFSLKSGWSNEEIVYDFVKLMDSKNPFHLGVSQNIILRENELASKKGLENLESHIQNTISLAKERLNGEYDRNRILFFIISEISKRERRHWIYDQKREVFIKH